MKRFPLVAVAAFVPILACASRPVTVGSPTMSATTTTAAPNTRTIGTNGALLGVQLWSFREAAKSGVGSMLTMTRRMGFTHIETAGLYGLTAAQFADSLKAAGLRATSMHVGYDDLKKNPQAVIANANALGAKYVGLAWYPHQAAFTEADARRAIADFNSFGRTMKDAGLTFFYHNHGYEPVPFGDGTLLDLIIKETDPSLVKFEMDVLWTFLPNVDPAALIKKYPGRFKLMHIKDMKPGIARGSLAGGLADSLNAAIGQGQVNWAEVLSAASKDGLEYYYIEDETTDPVNNAPKSVAYLEKLKY
jgi:sugar phosphate isomerase/epimerase